MDSAAEPSVDDVVSSVPAASTPMADELPDISENIEWCRRPAEGAVKIELTFIVNHWKVAVSPAGERLMLRGSIIFVWKDPRIASLSTAQCRRIPKNIWRPTMLGSTFESSVSKDGVTLHNKSLCLLQLKFTFHINDDADDHVVDSSRLQAFPWDRTRYNFTDCLSDEIYLHTAEDIDVNFEVNDIDWIGRGFKKKIDPIDWYTSTTSGEHRLEEISFMISSHQSKNVQHPYIDWGFSVTIARDNSFYISKIFLPLACLWVFSMLVFAYPPIELEPRLNQLTTLYLTLFAIQWTVMDRLPMTPESTVVDSAIWSVAINLLMVAIGSVVSFRLALADDSDGENLHDEGWGFSRASVSDSIIFGVAISTMTYKCVITYLTVIRRMQQKPPRWSDGIDGIQYTVPIPGRAWRYSPTDKIFIPVKSLVDF